MINFTESNNESCRAIAVIVGGKQKTDKIVYLHTDPKDLEKMKSDKKVSPIILGDEWFKKRKVNIKEVEILYKAYVNNMAPKDEKLNTIYMEMIYDLNLLKNKQVQINDGHFEILPNTNKRDVIYLSGASGSGKSTFANSYIEKYLKIFDQNNVYIFSKVENDSSLNLSNERIHKIVIDNSILKDPIEVDELDNSLVLFDDVDTIQQKPLLKAMENLKDSICQEGRHTDTYCLITSHMYTNYAKTRIIVNESTGIVFFLNSGSSYHISRFLKVYVGCDGPTIKKLLSLRSRWVYINLTAPRYVVSENSIFLL